MPPLKKKLKYIVLFVLAAMVAGILIFRYYVKSLEIIKHIPADVSFCLTFDKKKLTVEIQYWDRIKRDTILKAAGNNLSDLADKIITSTGINPLGEIAVFGKKKSICIAWTGLSKKSFKKYLNSGKYKVEHRKNYDFVKINKSHFLCYDWPLLLLSNNLPDEKTGFYSNETKKLSILDLQSKENTNSTVFGFVNSGTSSPAFIKLLPVKEKAYISMNIGENETEIKLFQKNYMAPNTDFLPEISDSCLMVLSCPWDTAYLNSIEILPDDIIKPALKIISKPVNHINFEVLDTISSVEQIITYLLDDEFKLTQKIFYKYKTYPGLYAEFFKTREDTANISDEQEFFKQNFSENTKSYILQSGTKTFKKLPLYYFYANVELLKNDPFWKNYCISAINKILITSTPQNKGSIIKIKFYY